MNIAPGRLIFLTAFASIGVAVAAMAFPARSEAQTPQPAASADIPASHSSAQSEAGEPRAVTSPDDAPAAAEHGADERGSGEHGSAAGSGSEAAGGAHGQARPEERRGASPKAEHRAGGSGKAEAVDKMQLGTATVTGDREQPKVMYIVPWKKSDIGDLSGRPMNSLLDEALAPIDRDEFKREVMYYQAVRADASQNGAAAGAPGASSGSPR